MLLLLLAFSNASVFGVHTENRSFSKRSVLEFMRFHFVVEKLRFYKGAM